MAIQSSFPKVADQILRFNKNVDNIIVATTDNADDDIIENNFSGRTFASPIEYSKTVTGIYGTSNINDNYKKVMDLIATFSPTILDEFEKYFLLFVMAISTQINIFKDYWEKRKLKLLKHIIVIKPALI